MKALIKSFANALSPFSSRLDKVLFLTASASLFLTCVALLLFSNTRPLNLLYYGTFGVAAASTVVLVIKRRDFIPRSTDIAIITFVTIAIVSKAANPSSSFPQVPLVVSAIYLVCSRLFNKGNVSFFLWLLTAAFLVFHIAFLVYYRQPILHARFDVRLGAVFQNENTTGYFLLYGLCLFLWASFHKKWHLFWLLPALASLVFILYTGSRSALIIALIVSFLYLFLLLPRRLWWIAFSLLALSMVGILLVLNLPALSWFAKRIAQASSGKDYSTNERLSLAQEAFQMFLAKPVCGWGYNGMSVYSTRHLFAHNNFLGLASDYGLFGLIAFEFLLFLPFAKLISGIKRGMNKNEKFVLMISLSVFCVQFFYVNSQLKFEYIFLALAAAQLTPIKKDVYFI